MKRQKDILVASLLAILIGVIVLLFAQVMWLPLYSLPLVFLQFRRGIQATVTSIIVGVIIAIISYYSVVTDHWLIELTKSFAISGFSVIAGFFAKNVHRTLNNKRMQSVWLNVSVVSILIGSLTWLLSGEIVAIVMVLAIIVLVMGAAYTQPKLILTKHSPFLTNKERSKLLND